MKSIGVYLTFEGQCSAAIDFYQQVFKAELISKKTFGESPMEAPEHLKDQIMHAEIKAGDFCLMASDNLMGMPTDGPGKVTLNIDLEDQQEQDRIFAALSENGSVTMELQETFWGARFGSLVDQFGIKWMLHMTLPNS